MGLTCLDTSGGKKIAKIVHFSIDLLMTKRFTMQYEDLWKLRYDGVNVKAWWCVWMFESIMGSGRSFKILTTDGASALERTREDTCFHLDIMVETILLQVGYHRPQQ